MPSKFSWPKSNRAHSSAESSGHPSPVPSVNNEVASQQPQPLPPNQQPSIQQIPQSAIEPAYGHQFPQRATSHRHSTHLSLDQTAQHVQGGPPSAGSQHSPGIEQRRGSYQPQSTPYGQHETHKKSLGSRITARLTGHSKDGEEHGRHSHKNGLGRRVSIRRSDGQPDNYSQSHDRLQTGKWNQRQGSSPHLPTSTEQDESNLELDPFLQQGDDDTPEPPPKDIQYQQHSQRFAPNALPQQYNRPPLARVETEGSYHTQGGVEQQHYSPDHHQGTPTPQQPPQQQYQSYQPPALQQQQSATEYQAFNPQTAPSPHPSNASHELIQPQQSYYQYLQQQPLQQQHLQQQVNQDTQQSSPHYQQQYSPLPPLQQAQDFSNPHGQDVRPPSQHQEIHLAQTTRTLSQSRPSDTSSLQQLRPPSSQQLAPPSPVQQPPPYQAYDAQQQNRPSQTVEVHAESTTQQGQDSMPAGQQRNTLRKVNEAGGPPPGAPSRESSLLQQPSAKGQNHGKPPVSPGVATFGANVVPTASQGQPYRGESQGQQDQVTEMGRATPVPRSTSDISEEEVAKLRNDLETLREKYQKVKRYFFDKEAQVHALQNTLANQRMSLSRTSMDDSEYATRFSRLDGLIAQLSFAIRKDWKSIPPWLQTVVNKNAVETGKQEMTAVGRAFISSWLVENIFDKYFHPDLDPGLSTQLKTIQLNIRKLSPPCHTAEDEEALVAKVVNWRLATLEGLAEVLRSPQSPTNRQHLVETLNESLIGSLQMYLNDPAPADLNGGVPMIIELAVNVAQHLPLESREVHIEYFPPGHGLVPDYMKMETGIPALTNPILEFEDAASMRSVASKMDDASSLAEQQDGQAHQSDQLPKEGGSGGEKKWGMFGFGGAKKPAQSLSQRDKRESSLGQGGSQQSLQNQNPPGSSSGGREEQQAPRVRMAVGVAVQIRGKSILVKAPVYST